MVDLKIAVHVFASVLVIGTIWRLTEYHLLASDSTWLKHLGAAMAVQY